MKAVIEWPGGPSDTFTFAEPGYFRAARARREMRHAGDSDWAGMLIFAQTCLSRREFKTLESRRASLGDARFFEVIGPTFWRVLEVLFPANEEGPARSLPAVASERPSGPHWSRIRWNIARRDNWTCINGCGRTGLSFQKGNGPSSAHVDHITPLARGGHATDPKNLQLLCGPCNLAKGAKVAAPWV